MPTELSVSNLDHGTNQSLLYTTPRHRRNTRYLFRILSRLITLQRTFFVYWILLIILILYLKKYFPISLTHTNKDGLRLDEFMRAWCRVRNCRVDWKQKLASCRDNLNWGEHVPGWGRVNETSAVYSYISLWDVRSAGEFSSFTIQTVTANQQLKIFGGDSWRVIIKGPSSVSPTVFDMGDGKYEVIFLILEPGVYRVNIILDYSLCDGIKQPPRNWFKIGNVHGGNQRQGSLSGDAAYLNRPLWFGTKISFTITPPEGVSRYDVFLGYGYWDPLLCGSQCPSLLWDGYGRWVNDTWIPFIDSSPRAVPRKSTGVFWIYGDSLGARLFKNLQYSSLCTDIFERCNYTYNWIYRVENQTKEKSLMELKGFDKERIFRELKEVILLPEMNEESAILINFGIHFVVGTNFTEYRELIDGIVDIFTKENLNKTSGEKIYKGNVIWKTTTAVHRERLANTLHHSKRFMTSPRVELYNSYATLSMCQAGISVLDVYPLTESFPGGTDQTYDPHDAVHYKNYVFHPAEELLEGMFMKNNEEQEEIENSGNSSTT